MDDKKYMFDYQKAAESQRRLSLRVNLIWDKPEIKTIAGADCSYNFKNKKVGAKVVVCSFPDLEVIDSSESVADIAIPYVPGFLNFREAPAYIRAFNKLKTVPDLIFIDGNGIAHPRRMGIATYLGVVLDVPTVGCAKSPFYPFRVPDKKRGCYTLYKNNSHEKIGYCLRTRTGIKPIFVSPGHRIDFNTSKDLVLSCCKFRIPEPIRFAHRLAGKLFVGGKETKQKKKPGEQV